MAGRGACDDMPAFWMTVASSLGDGLETGLELAALSPQVCVWRRISVGKVVALPSLSCGDTTGGDVHRLLLTDWRQRAAGLDNGRPGVTGRSASVHWMSVGGSDNHVAPAIVCLPVTLRSTSRDTPFVIDHGAAHTPR